MAKKDKQTGISSEDMEAYKQLNKELGENGFPTVKKANGKEHNPVRGPEDHGNGLHGHVGPVNHIPINKNSVK